MDSVFYENGLRFACTRCSNCCRHEPGFVFLSETDIQQLASGLKIEESEVIDRFCRRVSIGGFSRLSLKEKENYDCVFWQNGGCEVYEFRPLQCRTYPFWSSTVADADTWEAEKAHCPGIGNGRLYSREEIDALLEARLNDPLLS